MLQELEKFRVLVDSGSFTSGSLALGITQPALSTSIKKLEHDLGLQLVLRTGKGLIITQAGEEVYDSAKRLKLEISNLNQRLMSSERTLKIGMIDSIGVLLFSHNQHLQQSLEVTVDNSKRLTNDVLMDRLDMAFITNPQTSIEKGLEVKLVGSEKFVLVSSLKDAEEIKNKIQSTQTLPNFLTYNAESTTHQLITQLLEDSAIKPQTIFRSTNPELLKLLVLRNKGVALLPKILVRKEIENRQLAVIDTLSFRRSITAIYRSDKKFSSDLESLFKKIKQLLAKE